MDFPKDLTGSLFWAMILSLIIYFGSSIAIGFLSKKSTLLKPVGSGLKLIALFLSVQVFLHVGAAEYYPRISYPLNFISWLVFTFAALRLGLYLYGDLFVVRWRRGSFPAAFKNIITVFVLVIVALILLKEILDINVTSLIATTTVLTATIGLAFQSTLANMLAGLTIHLEKPLKQGDWISAGGHEGRVMDITLRSTRIQTIEHNEVFIPNSKVLSEAVVNYSLPNTTQVRKLVVSVSYLVPPNKVKGVIMNVLTSVQEVSPLPEPIVRVMNYGDSSMQYEIRYSISDFSRHINIENEIMNLLWYRFKRAGIAIPIPVNIQSEACDPGGDSGRAAHQRGGDRQTHGNSGNSYSPVKVGNDQSGRAGAGRSLCRGRGPDSAGRTGRLLLHHQERQSGCGR